MEQYEFLRQLTVAIPGSETKKMFLLFSTQGIDLYVKADDKSYIILKETDIRDFEQLFISAADREAAVTIMENAGLSEFISENKRVLSETASLVEQAENEYYRKRKVIMYECLVVLLAAMLFYLIRAWT